MISVRSDKNMETVKFLGQDCVTLENGAVKLLIAQSIGPRILWLSLAGGKNLLAEVPDFVVECPGSGPFHFYGGHRLWHAPELIGRTYLPDDSPVTITDIDGGLLVTQDIEARTGLQKSIDVRLKDRTTQVEIIHRITNRGVWPVTCAPWAITQLKTGGVAILPQITKDTGVLPNRSVSLWPYTNPSEPNVKWGRTLILVEAKLNGPFKIGFPNPRGWLAYWLDGTLFVKRSKYEAQAAYYDFGSSSEFYCNNRFAELETLGPSQTIEPEETAVHVETWELHTGIECPGNETEAQSMAAGLGLG